MPQIRPRKRNEHLDKIIGLNLRNLRVMAGISQEQLADRLDISFQQIQKYEKGNNRIAASTMYGMSKVLKCDILSFFEGLDEDDAPVTRYSRDQAELVRLYANLPSNRARKNFRSILKSFAEAQNGPV